MTKARENMLRNRAQLLYWISELDRCVQQIAVSGTASASLSAGGGSQSYTHQDLAALEALRGRYVSRLKIIDDALAGYVTATGIRHVVTVRNMGVWPS